MNDAGTSVPSPKVIDDLLRSHVGLYPDFPAPGVLFRDVTPVLRDREVFAQVISYWASIVPDNVDIVVGTEARGFMFGAPLALEMGAGFVPVRKAGKLPGTPEKVDYDLEYGSASIEIPEGALSAGDRVLVLDDLLATGGTAAATIKLIEGTGAQVLGASFLIELVGLGGREVLGDTPITTVWSVPN